MLLLSTPQICRHWWSGMKWRVSCFGFATCKFWKQLFYHFQSRQFARSSAEPQIQLKFKWRLPSCRPPRWLTRWFNRACCRHRWTVLWCRTACRRMPMPKLPLEKKFQRLLLWRHEDNTACPMTPSSTATSTNFTRSIRWRFSRGWTSWRPFPTRSCGCCGSRLSARRTFNKRQQISVSFIDH